MSDIRIKMAKDLRDMSDMVGDLHWMAAKAVEDLIKKDARIMELEEQRDRFMASIERKHKLMDEDAAEIDQLRAELAAIKAQGVVMLGRDAIREVFMRNGFTIKDGQDDLKPYVYAAAEELLRLATPVQQVSVPDGWKLVPIEPTPEMIDVAAESDLDPFDNIDDELCAIYAAMLAAAPAAPAADAGVTTHD